MKKNDIAIVVVGFDGYKELWKDFFSLFYMNWADCPYKLYLITNEIIFESKKINVIPTSSEDEWSNKVRKAINLIDENYICLLLEDFFIAEKVDTYKIEYIINFIKKNKIKYLKMPYRGQFSRKGKKRYKNNKNFFYIFQDEKYNLTLLPSIWEKNFLKEKIAEGNYSPWKFEIDRIKEAAHMPHIKFNDCIETDNNPLNILNGVIQGEFLPSTVEALRKRNYTIKATGFKTMGIGKYIFIRIKTYGLFYIPKFLQNSAKSLLKKFNVSFVSEEKN